MIYIKFKINDGEHEYFDWSYYESFTLQDYKEGKINDQIIMEEVWCIEQDEDGIFWDNDTRTISIHSVQNLTKNELKTLDKFYI
tara:strand:+ start:2057 stop:2308 length:252 start_codon:yes stop_codon:yes gene_type:complete